MSVHRVIKKSMVTRTAPKPRAGKVTVSNVKDAKVTTPVVKPSRGRPKLRLATFERETKNNLIYILGADGLGKTRRVYVTPDVKSKVVFEKSERQEKEGICWYIYQPADRRWADKFAIKRDSATAPASLSFSLS